MDITTNSAISRMRVAILAGAATLAAFGIVYAIQSPTGTLPPQEAATLQAPLPALNETRPQPEGSAASVEGDGTVYMYE